jgi:hypothetical protein
MGETVSQVPVIHLPTFQMTNITEDLALALFTIGGTPTSLLAWQNGLSASAPPEGSGQAENVSREARDFLTRMHGSGKVSSM